MTKLVLIRHGQSEWNQQNLFTGWVDVDLSTQGEQEAIQAGEIIKTKQIEFDYCYTSMLKRAIRTLWLVLLSSNRHWLSNQTAWQLNERHYGKLQGLNKQEVIDEYGEEQVKIWRRSFDIPPPLCDIQGQYNPAFDPRYKNIATEDLPLGESLKNTYERVIPFWDAAIAPQIKSNKNVLVVAHGNSLRALMKHIEKIDDKSIVSLEIPTGKPILYEIQQEDFEVISRSYL